MSNTSPIRLSASTSFAEPNGSTGHQNTFGELKMVQRTSYLGIAVVLVSCLASSASAGEIPDVLYNDWEYFPKEYPTWVSADAATDEEGNIVESLFHPMLVDDLRSLRSLPVTNQNCKEPHPFSSRFRPPTSAETLEETLELAEIVVIGEVTDRAAGFERGYPGWMVLVETNESVKGPTIDYYYIFISQGTIPTGIGTFCINSNYYPNVEPQVGDRLVLVLENVYNPADPFVNLISANRVILLRDGSVHACSDFLAEDPKKSIRSGQPSRLAEDAEVLLDQVRGWASRQGGTQ